MPIVPPLLADKLTIGVRFAWTGDPAEGERLPDELRAVAPVLLDDAALAAGRGRAGVRVTPGDGGVRQLGGAYNREAAPRNALCR